MASVAKDMTNSNVEFAFGPQNKYIAIVHQGNVLSNMSDTQSDTSSVLRVIQNAHSFATKDGRFSPAEGFSKTSELSGVIAARK